jgi:hypothetical protein
MVTGIGRIVAVLPVLAARSLAQGAIDSGEVVSGEISALGKQDAWSFVGTAGDRIVLIAANQGG